MKRTLIVVGVMVLVAGCAQQTATIRQLRPAEVNALVGSLAVLDIQGREPQGQTAQETLEAKLQQSGFYALAREADLGRAATTPLRYQDGNVNMPAVLGTARQLGIDAVLMSSLDFREASGARYGTVSVRVGDPKVAAKLQYELVDCRTGQILDQGTVSSEYYQGELTQIGTGKTSESEVLTNLAREAATRLAEGLAPHGSAVEVPLAGKSLGRGVDEIRRGIQAAQREDWNRAIIHWNAAIQDDPRNHIAWYNLGLAHEALHQFRRARESYERALKIQKRSLYEKALVRLDQAASDYELAVAQRARVQQRPPLGGAQLAQRADSARGPLPTRGPVAGSRPADSSIYPMGGFRPPSETGPGAALPQRWPIQQVAAPQAGSFGVTPQPSIAPGHGTWTPPQAEPAFELRVDVPQPEVGMMGSPRAAATAGPPASWQPPPFTPAAP